MNPADKENSALVLAAQGEKNKQRKTKIKNKLTKQSFDKERQKEEQTKNEERKITLENDSFHL